MFIKWVIWKIIIDNKFDIKLEGGMYFASPSGKAPVVEENLPETRHIMHVKWNPTKSCQ